MRTPKNLLRYNSALAFVLAGLVATTLHEVAHFITALVADGNGLLTPGYVGLSDTITKNNAIISAAAGPLFSLLSGLLIIYIARNWGQGFTRLFWTWLGFLSAQIGFGYFLVCLFAKAGDTGFVLSSINASWLVYAAITAIGAVGTYFILPKMFSASTSRYVKNKKEFFQLGMYPWLIGTLTLVVIYTIIESVVMHQYDLFSMIGTATIGIFVPLANYNAKVERKPLALRFNLSPLVLTTALALLLIFGLSQGIAIGQ